MWMTWPGARSHISTVLRTNGSTRFRSKRSPAVRPRCVRMFAATRSLTPLTRSARPVLCLHPLNRYFHARNPAAGSDACCRAAAARVWRRRFPGDNRDARPNSACRAGNGVGRARDSCLRFTKTTGSGNALLLGVSWVDSRCSHHGFAGTAVLVGASPVDETHVPDHCGRYLTAVLMGGDNVRFPFASPALFSGPGRRVTKSSG